MRRLPLLTALLAAGALAAAGCGDDGSATSASTPATGTTPATVDTTTGPVASAPDAKTPPPAAATTPLPETTPSTTPGGATAPGEGSGATDEPQPENEPVRVPAAFKVLGGGELTPRAVTVPPFLAVEVSVANPDSAQHVVVVKTPRPQTLRLPGGASRAVRMPGLRAGTYAITLDGRPAGQLIVGGEVGP